MCTEAGLGGGEWGCGHRPRTGPPGALGVEILGPALSMLDADGETEASVDHHTSSRMNLGPDPSSAPTAPQTAGHTRPVPGPL